MIYCTLSLKTRWIISWYREHPSCLHRVFWVDVLKKCSFADFCPSLGSTSLIYPTHTQLLTSLPPNKKNAVASKTWPTKKKESTKITLPSVVVADHLQTSNFTPRLPTFSPVFFVETIPTLAGFSGGATRNSSRNHWNWDAKSQCQGRGVGDEFCWSVFFHHVGSILDGWTLLGFVVLGKRFNLFTCLTRERIVFVFGHLPRWVLENQKKKWSALSAANYCVVCAGIFSKKGMTTSIDLHTK